LFGEWKEKPETYKCTKTVGVKSKGNGPEFEVEELEIF